MELSIEHGALTRCPVWEEHKRGTNWWAKIWTDPSAPAGLGRDFAVKARGEFFYMVPTWAKPGVAVEFAGDYASAGGRKTRNRVYAVITEILTDQIVIQTYETASKAIKAAQDYDQPDMFSDPYKLKDIPTEALMAELKRRNIAEWDGAPVS